jgi:streptogramin lyase
VVDDDDPVLALAVDRQGMVYVVQQGIISIYEGVTGELRGEVAYAGGQGFNDVAVTADGGLVASWYRARDDLVRFDRQKEVAWVVESAISGQTDGSELNMRVSVDGLGNIYALGSFSHAVFQFSPEGKYVSRFGGQGHEPGQFRAERAIAVDGKGRVYVADSKGIQVFDADGRYLDVIDVKGAIFGMAFDDEGALWAAARDKVIKFEVVGQ